MSTINLTFKKINKKIVAKVIDLNVYPTFKELYENNSLAEMGYNKEDYEKASYKDMLKYYSHDEQLKNSVVAIRIQLIQ